MVSVIKNDTEYRDALEQIEILIDSNVQDDSAKADELEVLALLVENYESSAFHRSLPSPIEAIKFRMEQQNLSQRDLVPYMGSRSKVSEVLSGKRPLTLSMIRALHANLGIRLRSFCRSMTSQFSTSRRSIGRAFQLKK